MSPYRLLIAPRLFCVDEQTASNLISFVASGGVLCLTAASGVVDEHNVSFDTPRPGPLAEIAGIRVSDLAPLHSSVPLETAVIAGLDGAQATTMADEIHPTTARVLAAFAGGWRKGLPAITENAFGQGRVIYLGTVLEDEALDALVTTLCNHAGVQGIVQTPDGVSAYERCGPKYRLLFLLNYTDRQQTEKIDPGAPGRTQVSQQQPEVTDEQNRRHDTVVIGRSPRDCDPCEITAEVLAQ